jgi:hypothetical protein
MQRRMSPEAKAARTLARLNEEIVAKSALPTEVKEIMFRTVWSLAESHIKDKPIVLLDYTKEINEMQIETDLSETWKNLLPDQFVLHLTSYQRLEHILRSSEPVQR